LKQGLQEFLKNLMTTVKNASPARLPTTIPMIVVSGKESDLEDDAFMSEPEVEPLPVPVGPELNTFVEVCTEPSAAVIVACTVAGSDMAV
jgi:hypothetical protein